jgi:hypothetical protein
MFDWDSMSHRIAEGIRCHPSHPVMWMRLHKCIFIDFKAPTLPLSLRLKVSGCHYYSIYNNTWTTLKPIVKKLQKKVINTLVTSILSFYSAHSVRSAASSKVRQRFVPIREIMEKAGWSNTSTFFKFYNKPIKEKRAITFGLSLLQYLQQYLNNFKANCQKTTEKSNKYFSNLYFVLCLQNCIFKSYCSLFLNGLIVELV